MFSRHKYIKSIQLPVVFRASNVGLYDTQKAGFVQEFKDWSGYKTYQPRSGGGTTNTVDFFSLCLIFDGTSSMNDLFFGGSVS